MIACRRPFLIRFGEYASCELPRKHRGRCGVDQGQHVERKPAHYQTTSALAYESVAPAIGTIERQILDALVLPRTTDELEILFDGRHQTISAAVSRLWHDRALIRPSGLRRRTRSGRWADVYERIR